MTSVKEKCPRNFRKWEASCNLQNEVTQSTTACAWWNSETIRLTREVAEQKHEENRRETLALLICSSTPSGMGWFATLYADRRVASHCRTRDQWPLKVRQKRNEAETFEFEPWPQASKFNSWKVSFRRGSTHPRWFSIGELDHSGLVFDKNQMELETLDSKIAKGIMKMKPANSKRNINFSEETQQQEEMSNAFKQANQV